LSASRISGIGLALRSIELCVDSKDWMLVLP
jgi:hypothetical protein